jgi:hypothetical protein
LFSMFARNYAALAHASHNSPTRHRPFFRIVQKSR